MSSVGAAPRSGGWRLRLAAALGVVASVAVCVFYIGDAYSGYLMDLSVFRDAGYALSAGYPLYSEDFPSTSGFRFIYPPVAALLFVPMTLASPLVLQVLWTVANVVIVGWMVQAVLERLSVPRPWLVAVAVLAPTLLLEPVRSNFGFGQINLVLMALVVADCLDVTPRRFRGAGIGIAAAVKITPAAFGLLLLLRRDTPSIVRAAGAFLIATGVGALAAPSDSVYFWATEFFNTERAGGHSFTRNQAVTGMLARLGADGILKDAVWLGCVVVIVAAAAWAGYRFTRAGEPVVALGVVALAILMSSPIAVTHHWVYSLLLIPILVDPRYRSWRPLVGAATAIFIIGPHVVLDRNAVGVEAVLRHLGGNAQLLVSLVLLAAAAIAARSRTESATEDSSYPVRVEAPA
ncbi:glycosyltransferase 87 family protein [Prescottella equi]